MKVIYLRDDYILINEDDRIIKKEYKYEKGIVTATLPYKHIININFKLSKPLEEDMLEIEAEKYLFTNGSLDYSKEYKIVYKFKDYEDFYNVEAFVVEIDVLNRVFEKHLKTFKYIDFISANPFIFESFYDISGVLPQNDLFIFLSEDEAFVSCFENGEFLFVKSLTKLSNLSKILGIESEELKNLLLQKGLDESRYEEIEIYNTVDNFFSELFMKVSHLINFSVSNYRLNGINNIYFYSPFEINKIFEKYSDFWNLSGVKFKRFTLQSEYDPFEYCAVVYNSKHYQNENENFSIYPRPVPFYKRKSGQFILFVFVVIFLIGADILYKEVKIQNQQSEISILQEKIARQKRLSDMLRIAYKNYKNKISKLKSEEISIQKEIDKINSDIAYLYNIQTSKPFCDLLAENTNLLSKNSLKLISFDKKDKHIKMIIMSRFENSSSIAKFLNGLIKSGYKNVFSKKITSDKNIYISEVSYDE
ncbi:hypothetical protein [Caminibacter sp.]